jgi:Zn-dependent peptidase ImmA (M78 family)
MKTIGDIAQFALAFELRTDPDTGGDPAERASWGAFQVWVGGRNLTAGRADGASVDAAEIPLLPIVRWLVLAWNPLLHEERLPRPGYLGSAASWRMDSLASLVDGEGELDGLLEDRDAWWRRHGLGSALPEYRVPDVHIRRMGTSAEISWDDREWRTVPRGVRLVESPGAVVMAVEVVARVLFDWSLAVLVELQQATAAEADVVELRRALSDIEAGSKPLERLTWAAGPMVARTARHYRRMLGVTSGTIDDTVRSLLGVRETMHGGLITPLTVPAMLCRSASPALSASDLQQLLDLSGSTQEGHTALHDWQRHEPPPFGKMATTEDGYERALAFRDALGLDRKLPLANTFDLEDVWLPRLGIQVVDVRLEDSNVDGVAIMHPGRKPVVAVNLSGKFASKPWGRRMTLAHELCHLLYDMDDLGQVGIVSNPWAPQAMERRANAFAAMLLMPRATIDAVLPHQPRDWTTKALHDAMAVLGVGKTTLVYHLYNLGKLSASERDAWLDEL